MVSLSKILIAKAILVFCFNLSFNESVPFYTVKDNIVEVPIMKLNFYMMNRSDAEAETLRSIRKNVEYLNKEFQDVIKFEIEQFFVDEGHAYLPDLHQEYFGVEELTVDSLVRDLESKGTINVFIFESYFIEDLNAELMGFTPIFKASHKEYVNASPSFDRIFLAYNALGKQTTLVHEMGHFLGLDHPWEMSEINQGMMGLHDEDAIQENHMAYGPRVSGFTNEQLARMQHFALQFRRYLVNRSEFRLRGEIAFNQ
ncbi:zinc metalloprotease [Portibacter marinus]|uniref:hypothetical protein n=1 Tax=Portibacter marinus TaxID=2898660 RepID=UPI001F16A1C1|nr:hypothetical protein [Portibacter marinus]